MLATSVFLILFFAGRSYCSEGMGISSANFLKRMGYACFKVKNGISGSAITSGVLDAGKGKKIVECGSRLMLVLTESEKGNELLNVAVVYLMDINAEDGAANETISRSYENIRFESICRQLIFSLDSKISDSETESTLKSIGIYGNMLDGVQRSRAVNGYKFMLKLQQGGILMMVVSKI